MLRSIAKQAIPAGRYALKKSMWVSLFAFIIWSGVEAYDGASERFQTRYAQAKDTVTPPVESTYEKVSTLATNLWASIEANPGPSLLALGIFIFTIVYHKVSGKTLKEAFANTLMKAPLAPSKPSIIQKAEQELLQEKLISKETELHSLVNDLPYRIVNALETAKALEKEAERAKELAETKERRAKKAAEEHASLVALLETARTDLAAVKEQLKAV